MREETIRIGTMAGQGAKTAGYIRQILPHGFESFEVNFWQTLGGADLKRVAAEVKEVLGDSGAVSRATKPVSDLRGYQGGRFYVNEHGAIFTPVAAGDGNGLDYVYCGQIDRTAWFPEPAVA